MKAISTGLDGRHDIAENVLMAAVKTDDVHGPHVLIADIETGRKMQLIFSTLELLQLHTWSHDILERDRKIGEDLYPCGHHPA